MLESIGSYQQIAVLNFGPACNLTGEALSSFFLMIPDYFSWIESVIQPSTEELKQARSGAERLTLFSVLLISFVKVVEIDFKLTECNKL